MIDAQERNKQRKILTTITYNDLGIILDVKVEELDSSADLQPTCNQLATDCISRQEAIDLAEEVETKRLKGEIDLTYAPMVKGLTQLPSAQPEACEYYALCRHGRDENKLRARLGFCEYCNEDADGFVTPLEKNGHAFVRFGMDGWELSLRANRWHGSAKIRYCPMCGRDLLVKLGRKDEVSRNE